MRTLIPADERTAGELTDDRLVAAYAPPPGGRTPGDGLWVRFNFVSSVDGAATLDGVSGGLGGPGDRRLFALLRRPADVVLVGAGTVRAEGYDGPLVSAADAAWRRDHGLPGHPGLAVVSGSLDLDPAGPFFVRAPVRPLVLTSAAADPARRDALQEVADVVDCGGTRAEPARIRAELARRGHRLVHAEGGPTAFGSFAADEAVDELCLTLSPLLAGATGRRIIHGHALDAPAHLHLSGMLEEDGALFLRYRVTTAG